MRIFTSSQELPFAGHPTLGSAYAWLSAGGRPGVRAGGAGVRRGLVRLRQDGERLAFAAPPLTRFEPVDEQLVARIAGGLGLARDEILDAAWLVNGPQWIGIRLASAERVLSVQPDAAVLHGLDLGLVGPYSTGSEVAYEVRALLPGQSPAEDPVTGSLNAGLAYWLDRGRPGAGPLRRGAGHRSRPGGPGACRPRRDVCGRRPSGQRDLGRSLLLTLVLSHRTSTKSAC